jgi:hypothetical protein
MLLTIFGVLQEFRRFRRFSREEQGTRGAVLNRITPQFPKSCGLVLPYYKSLHEIRKGGK